MTSENMSGIRHQVVKNPQRQRILLLVLSISILLALWESITVVFSVPDYLLPSPSLVLKRFLDVFLDGAIFLHIGVTLFEVLSGLIIGACVAALFGYILAQSPTFEQIVGPYLVASQAIPIVAIAPLLVIWFGSGMQSKILICALIVFFPVLINTMVGIRSVSKSLYDLMLSLQATRWQTFRLLEVPAALPVFFGGLRIGATLSVIGAVVGEFVGSDRGMGFLINVARGQYDTAMVFVAIFILVAIALSLYGVVMALEHVLLAWQQTPSNHF